MLVSLARYTAIRVHGHWPIWLVAYWESMESLIKLLVYRYMVFLVVYWLMLCLGWYR